MCGVAGLVSRRGSPDLSALERIQNRLRLRGPDDSGMHVDGAVALAHLAGGRQPLEDRDRRHVLVANGEIYNFPIIRGFFESEGYSFSTHSDCEVILPLYARDGSACVKSLRGMFAFALWDTEQRKLMLARDRMGEKPLYYTFNDDYFIFVHYLWFSSYLYTT